MSRRVFAMLCFVAALGTNVTARADEDEHRLKWEYPRFRGTEVAAATAVSVADVMLQWVITDNATTGTHPIPWIDEPVRSALAADTRDGRERAKTLSAYFWHPTQYFPVIVDGLFVPLVTDKMNWDVAAQITALNWQAETLAFFFWRLSTRVVGRGRPILESCPNNPDYSGLCDNPDDADAHASFIAGHTAMAFSGAGLVCAHHEHLPLFGNRVADVGICVLALASATTTSYLRLVSDQHWTTDVLTGAIIGLGTGLGLPYLLHYRTKIGRDENGASFVVAPTMLGDGAGAAAMGWF